ncbi:MAG: PQQ-binding-like beta-propeller repeat protein [Sandaracinus sp.]
MTLLQAPLSSIRAARPARSAARALLVATLVTACGGGGVLGTQVFSQRFPDDRVDHVEAVVARLGAVPPEHDRSIVLLAASDPDRLLAYDLARGETLWEIEAHLETIPYVAGHYVVTQEPGGVVVRALDGGRETARIPDEEMGLIGADGDRDSGAVALSTGGAVGARSVLVGLSHGSPSFRASVDQAVGVPAVRGDMIFVPWGSQNLSVVEEDGGEIARVRVTRGVLGHAFVEGQHIFVGQRGLGLLSPELDSSSDVPWLEIADVPRPGSPPLMRDAYTPPPSPGSATHRVRLAFAPRAEGNRVALVDDLVVLSFYRLVFGLGDLGGRAAWAREMAHDVVGVSVREAGIFVVDDQGQVSLLSRTDGRTIWSADIGEPATFAAIDPGTFAPSGAPEGDALPLRDQLLAVSQSTDARLVPAREFAVRMMAGLEDPEVTTNLVALCDDRNVPASVRTSACGALATRTSGADAIVQALGRHQAFLAGTTAPAVGPLAQAALAMHEQRAAPLLVAQMRDPETRAEDLPAVFDALAGLGDASVLSPIEDFVRLYHAEPSDSGLAPGLTRAVVAYAALAGPTSRDLLGQLAADPMTMQEVRVAAQQALTAMDAGASTPSETPDDAGSGGGAMTFTEADDPRPRELTTTLVGQILDPARSELRDCLVTPGRVHGQARVVLVVEPSGQLAMVSVSPDELQACIEPIVRRFEFPATQARGRQRVTHVIRR